MKKLLKMLTWQEYILILINTAILIVRVYFEVALIDSMTDLIERVQIGKDMKSIYVFGRLMLAESLAIMICAIVSSYLVSHVASRFSERLRASVFASVNRFSQKEINSFGTASLITRCTNDITQIQKTVQMGLKIGVLAPVMALFSIVKIVKYSASLSGMMSIAIAFIFVLFAMEFFLTWNSSQKMQYMTDRLNSLTRENLTGVRVIRAYNAETKQEEKFERVNEETADTSLYISRVTGVMNPVMDLIFNGLCLAVYWYGAYLINDLSLNYSDIMGFSRYGTNILTFSMLFSSLIMLMPRAAASAKRVAEVLAVKPSVTFGTFDGKTDRKGEIEFRNVSFSYPDSDFCILENISFKASDGETVALIGATGSGKSTVVNLIPRFFDATQGEILLDGIDIRNYSKDALSRRIGFVPQKSILFSGTIRENITYGTEDLTDNEVLQALEIAQVDFVSHLEGGLDYQVAQNGSNLSGGQRQRLCIARAIAKSPEIYVLDDSFSALDYKTDQALRTMLREKKKDVTKIIVAQRVGTIQDADRIIVLDNGRVAGIGTHDELMKNCPFYREVAMSQLSEEELTNVNH